MNGKIAADRQTVVWDCRRIEKTKSKRGRIHTENIVNEYALHTREFLINKLDFLNGEVQKFIPATNEEHTGVVALDIKWKSGVHFIIYQTLWRGYYYAARNNEKISHTFHLGKLKKDSPVYLQRLINDIDNGRYDNKLTPHELYLKFVQEKGLTGYMNNTKWNKIFNIIRTIEEKTGKDISIMYKYIFDTDIPVYYWSVSQDEDLHENMYKYIEWLKIQPVACEYVYHGCLIEPKYTCYDYTSLFLEKMGAANLHYEYLQHEEAYIIYGYRINSDNV